MVDAALPDLSGGGFKLCKGSQSLNGFIWRFDTVLGQTFYSEDVVPLCPGLDQEDQ